MTNIKDSVFKIITSSWMWTWFIIKDNELVITNYHVVKWSKQVAVEDSSKNRFVAKVVMVNPDIDLAFLRVDKLSVKSDIKLQEDINLSSTDKIFTHGYPFGMPYTITEWIVSSPDQLMEWKTYLQTDAAVNPGNSWWPMLNKDWYLVAVTTVKFTDADNVWFWIKHTDLLKELKDYKSKNFKDNIYHVKCNSCDNFIEKETEFCDNCWNDIDSSVFDEFEKSNISKFIEKTLKKAKINPIICRWWRDYWEFHQWNALISIFVTNTSYLFIQAPLNKLPKQNLDKLLTFINSNKVPPFHLNINDNKIYLWYRIHSSSILSSKKDEISDNIIDFIEKTSELDKFFKKEFDCELAVESR